MDELLAEMVLAENGVKLTNLKVEPSQGRGTKTRCAAVHGMPFAEAKNI